jgi:myo-inositol-1(or 4)-monophosphatase
MGFMSNLECELIKGVREIGRDLAANSFNYGQVELKSAEDPVTELDRQTEMRVRELLERMPANFAIVGEEHGSSTGVKDHRYTAYIDPIDGTKSFVFQGFDSSIGLGIEDIRTPGQGVVGIVYDFMRDIMYVGSQVNGLRKLHVENEVLNIDRASLPQKTRILLEGKDSETAPLYAFLKSEGFSPYYNSGSFLLSMAKTGFGTFDGFISFPTDKMIGKSWDVAAGSVILNLREKLGSDEFTFRTFTDDDKYNLRRPETGFIALTPDLKKSFKEKYLKEY